MGNAIANIQCERILMPLFCYRRNFCIHSSLTFQLGRCYWPFCFQLEQTFTFISCFAVEMLTIWRSLCIHLVLRAATSSSRIYQGVKNLNCVILLNKQQLPYASYPNKNIVKSCPIFENCLIIQKYHHRPILYEVLLYPSNHLWLLCPKQWPAMYKNVTVQ